MKPLPLQIRGLGKYLPQNIVSSAELETRLALPDGWTEARAGVRERRYASGSLETTVFMAAQAAKVALERAGMTLGDLDAIIGACAAPQQTIPCTAALVQRELGAPEGSACFDVNATCLSFLMALQMAALLLSSGIYKNILIFSSERASSALNWDTPESATLFGDGAAAVVVSLPPDSTRGQLLGAKFQTFSSGADHTRIRGGGTLHHPNDPNTTKAMNLFEMDGPAIFRQAARLIGPFLDTLFTDSDIQRSSVDLVIPHQASKHALEQLTRLGFSRERVYSNLETRGNCVAASIPLALVEAWEAGKLEGHQKVLLVGTAAGLMLGGVLLEL